MEQRKSDRSWGQARPAALSMAKSAEAQKAGATQHSPTQRSQSARSSRRVVPSSPAPVIAGHPSLLVGEQVVAVPDETGRGDGVVAVATGDQLVDGYAAQ